MVGRTYWRALSRARAHLFLTFPASALNHAADRIWFGSTIAQGLGVGDGGDGSREGE